MKKSKKFVLPTSLVAGGMVLGAVFSPIGLSGAQTSGDTDEESTTEDASAADSTSQTERGRQGRQHRRLVRRELLEELGLSIDDLKAGHEAGQTLVETAAAVGVSEADLVTAIETNAKEHLDEAVANGDLDSDRAAEIEATLSDRIEEQINAVHEGSPGRGHERRVERREAMVETLTDLGLDEDALKEGREAGKTLAEVAAEAGVSEVDLVDALVSGAEERLAQAIEDGRVDADRAAERQDGLEDRITDRVNSEPGSRRGPGMRGERLRGQGLGGEGLDSEEAQETGTA